jgi:RimJ/RimL family protein N-acetyltransferase
VTRIKTDRLVIRPFEQADRDRWLELVNDPEVCRFLPPSEPATADDFSAAMAARHAMEERLGYCTWAVDESETNTLIGQCGIRPFDQDQTQTEMAYHYLPASWNKGYASEAATAVLGHAFDTIGLDRVMAIVIAENTGSWRVLEKAGMRYVGPVEYYGLAGLKQYEAERSWWRPPTA